MARHFVSGVGVAFAPGVGVGATGAGPGPVLGLGLGVVWDSDAGVGFGWKGASAARGEVDDRLAIRVAQLVGGRQTRGHLRRDLRCRLLNGLLGFGHLVERHGVEECLRQRQQDGDLRGHRHRCERRLLEAGANALSVRDDRARVVIHAGAESGECLQLLELRVGQLEVARDRAVRRALGLAADARDGLGDVDRGQHAQFEQRRREVDLTIGDRNQIRGNVRRDVLRLGLDDGQCGE